MWRAWPCVLALSLAGGLSCARAGAFACADDVQCFRGDAQGVCQPSGYCSFPDPDCPEGHSYGEHAGDGLAGTCVLPDAGGTHTDSSTSSGSTATATGATDPSTGVASTTSGAETATDTGGPSCGELGDGCGVITPCCGDCLTCVSGSCVAKTKGTSCGMCMACGELGTCDITPDAPCGTQTIECSDYVFGSAAVEATKQVACHAYAPGPVEGRCSDIGVCQAPDPLNCPAQPGKALVTCDAACHDEQGTCVSGAVAADITVASLCVTGNQTTMACDRVCTNAGASAVQQYACNDAGGCQIMSSQSCGAYACAGTACKTQCVNANDCADQALCNTLAKACYFP